MLRRIRLGALFASALLVFGGCGLEPGPDADTGGLPEAGDVPSNELPGNGPLIEDLRVIQNPSNALSYYVEWETSEPATTQLRLTCGSSWEQIYRSDQTRTSHRVFVMGLWAGANCRAVASGEVASGARAAEAETFEVGSLPSDLPELDVDRADGVEPGWTMFNLTNGFDNVPLIVAAIDGRGRYRWYHQLSTSNSGSDTEARVFREGVLIGGNRQYLGPHWIDWQGNILWSADFNMHHDIRPWDGGDSFLYLGGATECPDLKHNGGAVIRYDRSAEKSTDNWPLCEFYTPPENTPDWSHLNTIEPVPGEEAVILSSRTQHTLFKVDLADRELDWKMGIEGDFGLSGNERFFRQHAVEVLDNGNLLMFDNGSLRRGEFSRPWSRALEISYDAGEESAEVVWSYRPDPDLFAPIWGDADRLENGHTLVTFGLRNQDDTKNSRIVEVTEKGEVVWDVEAPNKWGWYRSDRLDGRPVGRVLTSDGS